MILIKNRLIVLYLKHSLFLRISIRLQALNYAGYKNASVQTTKSIINLKNFQHAIVKGAYLEPYLRF